ncbi:hypothetical protein ACFLX6_03215, partial [Chloroflexota bacterium]
IKRAKFEHIWITRKKISLALTKSQKLWLCVSGKESAKESEDNISTFISSLFGIEMPPILFSQKQGKKL